MRETDSNLWRVGGKKGNIEHCLIFKYFVRDRMNYKREIEQNKFQRKLKLLLRSSVLVSRRGPPTCIRGFW